jgi:hypothetical protein
MQLTIDQVAAAHTLKRLSRSNATSGRLRLKAMRDKGVG